jgi:hypothetical protein
MKQETKIKIIAAMATICYLVALFYWFKYTSRGVWGFIGWGLVGSLVGMTIGQLVVLPFSDEDQEKDKEIIVVSANPVKEV